MHGGFTESYGLSTEHLPGNMKKGDATYFGIEMPSKRKTVPSARPSTSTSVSTALTDIHVTSQIRRKYRRYS